MTPPSPLARLVAAVEAVGDMERWSMGRDESYDTLDMPVAKWDAILAAAQAARPVEGAEKARADAAWTELEDCRSYVAEIAQGVSHYPHDADEPCVRCERDALKLATTPTDAAFRLVEAWWVNARLPRRCADHVAWKVDSLIDDIARALTAVREQTWGCECGHDAGDPTDADATLKNMMSAYDQGWAAGQAAMRPTDADVEAVDLDQVALDVLQEVTTALYSVTMPITQRHAKAQNAIRAALRARREA